MLHTKLRRIFSVKFNLLSLDSQDLLHTTLTLFQPNLYPKHCYIPNLYLYMKMLLLHPFLNCTEAHTKLLNGRTNISNFTLVQSLITYRMTGWNKFSPKRKWPQLSLHHKVDLPDVLCLWPSCEASEQFCSRFELKLGLSTKTRNSPTPPETNSTARSHTNPAVYAHPKDLKILIIPLGNYVVLKNSLQLRT